MANKVDEFARDKESEQLRSIADARRPATETAEEGNHQFLTYLLKVAALETKELLEKHRHFNPERP